MNLFQLNVVYLAVTLLFFLTFLAAVLSNNVTECPNVRTEVGGIRKRRYLAFPDGSNVVLTISLVKAFMTHAPSGWNIALEIDVMYPLPDAKFTIAHSRKKLHHRQKREFWERLKEALDFHNMNGRACILQSICDARSYLAPKGKSLIHDILRAIFTAPLYEEDFIDEVKGTYDDLLEPDFCKKVRGCPFSLIHFLGSFPK